MSMKKHITSDSSLEKSIGFSRACRIDNIIAVSGTAPIKNGFNAFPGDVYQQTMLCIEISITAIKDAGGTKEDVVRTRILLTDISLWEDAAKAHAEVFTTIKPACTFVEVNGFIDKDWLVETEMDCVVSNNR